MSTLCIEDNDLTWNGAVQLREVVVIHDYNDCRSPCE
jgi:hypothetical protein